MNTKQNKLALITGANRGIGYAIAQGLLEADFQVIIGSRSLEKGQFIYHLSFIIYHWFGSRLEEKGGIPIIYFFNVPLLTLKERLAQRNTNLSEGTFEITPQMLETFSSKFEPPTANERVKIIELDGYFL